MIRRGFGALIVGGLALTVLGVVDQLAAQRERPTRDSQSWSLVLTPPDSSQSRVAGAARPAEITVDYPAEGSVFPPDFAAPRFIWRDAAQGTKVWHIQISFFDGAAAIRTTTRGERLRMGEIDRRCIAETNKLPALTPQQASSWSWKPDPDTWAAIKKHSVEHSAVVTITGFRDARTAEAVSRGEVRIETSRDPVGAPIFYRDVPLVPALGEKGVIKPLPDNILPYIQWRLRYVGEDKSMTMMEGLHSCANCHSFSSDGKTMGMDLDGIQNDKGLYSLTTIQPHTSIRNENMIKWTSLRPLAESDNIRVGFMSQVSPDGRYVVTMVNEPGPKPKSTHSPQDRIYVANFKDYRFGQVFFPTKGILAWYDRSARQLRLLPGADDPHYVQTAAFWSPDGKYLVFSRGEAKSAFPEGATPPQFANDPNETQMRYDLYRIPFNEGRGGKAEPIEGASQNGMSNSFAKVSPDGRWIVFVESRNGYLIRPDSQLYIVPFGGGQARRMKCNLPLMNSWHSFSPNSRWMVFSSKGGSPYTQMFLTHLDDNGNDSPPILIEDATAANRAVNLPEFVNVQPGRFVKLEAPVTDFFREFDLAMSLEKKKEYAAAIAEWNKALVLDPDDAKANYNLGLTLTRDGSVDQAIPHFQKSVEVSPNFPEAHNNLGIALMSKGKIEEAISEFERALEIEPDYGDANNNLGAAFLQRGRVDEAIPHFQKAVEAIPDFADAHENLGIALMEKGNVEEAIPQFQKVVEVKPEFADAHQYLGIALVQKGRAEEAIPHLEKALAADPKQAQAYYYLGAAFYLQGKVGEALSRWREGLHADPDALPLLSQTAWVLATCPDAAVRNGAEAVELAERAVKISSGPDPALLDVLAAAYAEVGRFSDAVQTAHQALGLAIQQGAQPLIENLKTRIALYESNSPFREAK